MKSILAYGSDIPKRLSVIFVYVNLFYHVIEEIHYLLTQYCSISFVITGLFPIEGFLIY